MVQSPKLEVKLIGTITNFDHSELLTRMKTKITELFLTRKMAKPVRYDPEENRKQVHVHEAQSLKDRHKLSIALCIAPSQHPLPKGKSKIQSQGK